MSPPKGDSRVGPLASLALGLPVPLLFALYSVYLGAVRPEPGPLRTLASTRAACLACAATALVGFVVLIFRSELRATWSRLRPNLANLVWLNLFTLLGPPLYFVAVVLLGAAAAVALVTASGAAFAQEKYTYLHHSTPTNVFWQAVKKGMDEACAQIDADCQMVFLQQDGNFQEQLNNLEATIAQKPDGIIMTFAGGEIFDDGKNR